MEPILVEGHGACIHLIPVSYVINGIKRTKDTTATPIFLNVGNRKKLFMKDNLP